MVNFRWTMDDWKHLVVWLFQSVIGDDPSSITSIVNRQSFIVYHLAGFPKVGAEPGNV